MYSVFKSKKYKKDIKKLKSRNENLDALYSLTFELQNKDFSHAYKNHKLEPKSKDIWECHIGSETSDWVLVYKYDNDKLILLLMRTGSHSDVLEK